MADNDSFGLRLLKSPLVWSGAGLMIRYAGDPEARSGVWATVGVVSLSVGIMYTIATHPTASPAKQLP
jgi:hypothetical protein